MKKLDKKVCIITGGGKGIGFGIAKAFANEGANIVITGRTQETLDKTVKVLEKEYAVTAIGIVADGGDEIAVKLAVAKTIEKFGRLDVLVNNAQVSKSGVALVDHTKQDFDVAINSGLYATFFYMRECFPFLKQSKGKVINFASGAGFSGLMGQASYAAAKEGIRGLSRVAAREWGGFGINVNVVAPLAFSDGLEQWSKAFPDLFNATIKDIPLQRYGDVEKDIGKACVFLASEDSSYITGETISVSGGVNLRP